MNGFSKTRIFDCSNKISYNLNEINFSKKPAKSTKLNIPLNEPNIKPKIRFDIDEEIVQLNKKNSRLVINRKTIIDIKNITVIDNKIINVVLIGKYFEIKKDKST